MGTLLSPHFAASMLGFSPVDESVASLCLRVGVACVYVSNNSSEYSAFLESLDGVLDAPCRNSKFLAGDFNTHMGNYSMRQRGLTRRNILPNVNLSYVLLLDFCGNQGCT